MSYTHRKVTFQSTLPARGATLQRRVLAVGGDISIHAPRTGSDLMPAVASANSLFQSTLPARGATRGTISTGGKVVAISIHAPRTGSDGAQFQPAGKSLRFQSTLPARGATQPAPLARIQARHFNPRSPHGERRRHKKTRNQREYFNPRSPHGERRFTPTTTERSSSFQSTLPARGATRLPPLRGA